MLAGLVGFFGCFFPPLFFLFLADFIWKQPNSLLLLKGKLTEHWGQRKRVLKAVLELGTAFYQVLWPKHRELQLQPCPKKKCCLNTALKRHISLRHSWTAVVGLQPKPYCRLKADTTFNTRDAGSQHWKLKHPALFLGAQHPSGWSCRTTQKNWEGMLQPIHSCHK